MKKLIATIALSSLALLPATSAWAGGSGPSTKDAPSVTAPPAARGATDPSAGERLWAWGCKDHQLFVVYMDNQGNFSGHFIPGSECDHDFTRMVA